MIALAMNIVLPGRRKSEIKRIDRAGFLQQHSSQYQNAADIIVRLSWNSQKLGFRATNIVLY